MPGEGKEVAAQVLAAAIQHVEDVWVEMKKKELELYEKRTQVLERIAMALEHYNEQKWHAVR